MNDFDDARPNAHEPVVNPYEAPATHPDSHHAGNPVIVPGVALLTLSSLFLLLLLASLPIQVMQLRQIDTTSAGGLGELTAGIACYVGWAAMVVAVLFGSICMVRHKGYAGALTAAVAASVPICSPFFVLGIPFGIWALIMLLKPDVRQRFG